jgi:hypothetical protein
MENDAWLVVAVRAVLARIGWNQRHIGMVDQLMAAGVEPADAVRLVARLRGVVTSEVQK